MFFSRGTTNNPSRFLPLINNLLCFGAPEFKAIPIIDLSLYSSPDLEVKQAFLKHLTDVCGFFFWCGEWVDGSRTWFGRVISAQRWIHVI